jgi:ATP/maltotriose-dependent transcriptional regulator MalT
VLYARTAATAATGEVSSLIERITEVGPVAGARAPSEGIEVSLAGFDVMVGNYAVAAERLEQVYQRALDEGDEIAQFWVASWLTETQVILGDWRRARRIADDALRSARRLAWPAAVHSAMQASVLVDAHLGTINTADPVIAELVAMGEHYGLGPAEIQARSIAGFLALSHGDARAAHAELGPLLQRIDQLGMREPSLLPLAWCELDALVELGELDQAAVITDDLHQRGLSLDRPFALATAARSRGRISAARGDVDTALAKPRRSSTGSAHDCGQPKPLPNSPGSGAGPRAPTR